MLTLACSLAMHSQLDSPDEAQLRGLELGTIDPLAKNQKVFREAVENGHVNSVKYMLQNYPINLTYNKNQYLKTAVVSGNKAVVDLFLAQPQVSLSDFSGDAFMEACAYGHTDIIRTLLSRDDFRMQDPHIHRALAFAVQHGHFELVKVLLMDGRADPAWNYHFAFIHAIANDDVKMAKLLLADPRVEVADIKATVSKPVLNGDNHVCEMLQLYGTAIDAAKYDLPLKIKTFDPEFFDVILHSACWVGKVSTVSRLIHMRDEIGPIFSLEAHGNLALELAIHSGKAELVMLLLENKLVKRSLSLARLDEILANVKYIHRNPLFTTLFDLVVENDTSLKGVRAIRMKKGKEGDKMGKFIHAVRRYQSERLPNIARLISILAQPVSD